jgi:hypothetical protein
MDFEELKFWLEVVQRAAIPADGNRLTQEEKAALIQSCRVLAQTAQHIADKVEERIESSPAIYPSDLKMQDSECLQNTNSRKRNAAMAVHFKVL